MYSFLMARIKSGDEYNWFTYTGKDIEIPYRNGKTIPLIRGEKFGVRPSSSGKDIRLVMGDDVNKVFTLDLDTAKRLGKNCEAL